VSPPLKQVLAALGNIIRRAARIGKTKSGLRQLKMAYGHDGCEICNQYVAGSTPATGTNEIKGLLAPSKNTFSPADP
jgi:hypothetical protein